MDCPAVRVMAVDSPDVPKVARVLEVEVWPLEVQSKSSESCECDGIAVGSTNTGTGNNARTGEIPPNWKSNVGSVPLPVLEP